MAQSRVFGWFWVSNLGLGFELGVLINFWEQEIRDSEILIRAGGGVCLRLGG